MTEKREETEVVDGSVVPTGGIVHQEKGGNAEVGVEPHNISPGTMIICKNGVCGMEVIAGVDRCPYCNTKQ